VRNVPVVSVNREPGVYSVNMVGADRATGATLLARDLILAGHARLAVVESGSQGVVSRAVRQAAARYGQSTTEVRVCSAGDVLSTVQGDGATAVICDCAPAAREIRAILEAANVRPGHDVSLATVGCCDDDYPSSGQYVDNRLVAQTVAELLNGNGSAVGHRPTMIWLATRWVDQGTTRALPRGCEGEAA
jgi:DNA-binding LacI/PurR family transcriptional regulator